MKKAFTILVLLLSILIILPSCSGKKSGDSTSGSGSETEEGVIGKYPKKSIEKIKEGLIAEDTITAEVIERTINTTKGLGELELSMEKLVLENMSEDLKTKFEDLMKANNYNDYVEYVTDIKKIISGYEIMAMLSALEKEKGLGGAMMNASAPMVYEMTKGILSQNPVSEGDLKVLYENKDKIESLKTLFK